MAIHGIQTVVNKTADLNEPITLEKIKADGRLLDIVGSHPSMLKVFEQVLLWAPTSANILILGETGAGKELVAQAIHSISPRAKKPFVVLDCSTLSKELLESELFGHEKGAFTGAYNLHLGRFERANGGTLFLDEMSNMSLEVQAKLLRVLQSKKFERIGGNREILVDVRVIAASNRSLYKCVEEGIFRQDLLYRLNTGIIEVPSLRERTSDITLLAKYFLETLCRQYMREDIQGFTPEALTALLRYDWPGNVRELRNVVERCIVLTKTPKIQLDVLPPHLIDPSMPLDNLTSPLSAGPDKKRNINITHICGTKPNSKSQVIDITSPPKAFATEVPEGVKRFDHEMNLYERYLVSYALKLNNNDITQAAKYLGLTRTVLHKKISTLGIDINN